VSTRTNTLNSWLLPRFEAPLTKFINQNKNAKLKRNMGMIDSKRKSYMELGEIYFWTATINNWQRLLQTDRYKQVIIDSLEYLSSRNKIDVFAFVIMPNHIHLIWRINENNEKETAQGSFLK